MRAAVPVALTTERTGRNWALRTDASLGDRRCADPDGDAPAQTGGSAMVVPLLPLTLRVRSSARVGPARRQLPLHGGPRRRAPRGRTSATRVVRRPVASRSRISASCAPSGAPRTAATRMARSAVGRRAWEAETKQLPVRSTGSSGSPISAASKTPSMPPGVRRRTLAAMSCGAQERAAPSPLPRPAVGQGSGPLAPYACRWPWHASDSAQARSHCAGRRRSSRTRATRQPPARTRTHRPQRPPRPPTPAESTGSQAVGLRGFAIPDRHPRILCFCRW